MSLRLNLYGCHIAAVLEAVGSQSAAVLQSACGHLGETISTTRGEDALKTATAWLTTLVQSGCPLASDRPQPSVSSDGGLLETHMETEVHVLALHSLIFSLRDDGWRDFSGESSMWHAGALGSLQRELRACGFTKSAECPPEFHQGMQRLIHGTPLFGDDFRSDWSTYCLLPGNMLPGFCETLQAAMNYEDSVPDYVPAEVRSTMTLRLSDNARRFVTEFSSWLQQISDAGQDAYILYS